jgi:hypothetical protein
MSSPKMAVIQTSYDDFSREMILSQKTCKKTKIVGQKYARKP